MARAKQFGGLTASEFGMTEVQELIPSIYAGWHAYQDAMTRVIAPLGPDHLSLRAAPSLRSVAEITAHMVGARARWFQGEGGREFEAFGEWDRREARARSADELVSGLEGTWTGMHAAISRWTPEDWRKTWPGEDDSEPEVITRQWVIWHLIEHDLHHGGEISITLGAHGVAALEL
jgi:uncharacterized damage-inducible protein DinB